MASRTSINVSLPKPLKQWVERQVKAGDYGTASEYVRSVLRSERNRIEDALSEGVKSPKVRMDDAEWASLRADARSRALRNRKTGTRRKSA